MLEVLQVLGDPVLLILGVLAILRNLVLLILSILGVFQGSALRGAVILRISLHLAVHTAQIERAHELPGIFSPKKCFDLLPGTRRVCET